MAKKKTKRMTKAENDAAEEADQLEEAAEESADRREYIATQVLAGLFAHSTYAVVGRAAKRALDEADALIKLLDANDDD